VNELLFFSHILVLVGVILVALRLGKSALIALLGLQVVIGNLFVTKQIVCFGFHITCTDVFTIGALFTLNLLQEYYGKHVAKRAIWIAFFLLFCFIVLSQLHLLYVPSPYDTMQQVFENLLAEVPRIMIASFVAGLLCQRLDVWMYGLLQTKFRSQTPILRFGGASLISQLIDTVLFSFLALYGLVHSMTHIILVSYLVKVSLIFCMAPFTTFSKRFVRDPIHI
jgi:uncharacterized integral membrane protein (TIGR00697 family)